MSIRRPHPGWWLYYQFRGRLPMRYREWVLHDGTCRTWLLRVCLRSLVQVSPLVVGVFTGLVLFGGSSLGGGSIPLAIGSVVLGSLVALRFALSYAEESVNYRLARHGYPPNHGTVVRRQAYLAAHAEEAELYRARWRNAADR